MPRRCTNKPPKRATVQGMRATAAASRWRVATLHDDEVARASAEAELAALGVRNAKRMCSLLVPMIKSGAEADETTISGVSIRSDSLAQTIIICTSRS